MIIDSLDNYKLYTSVNPLFEKAFKFVIDNMATLENGKYEIDGDKAFVMFVDAKMKTKEVAALEAHDKYIDIQIPISRNEGFGLKYRKLCVDPKDSYNVEKDIIFYHDEASNVYDLAVGEFIILFPDDVHAPLIGEGEIRKAIIKVLA